MDHPRIRLTLTADGQEKVGLESWGQHGWQPLGEEMPQAITLGIVLGTEPLVYPDPRINTYAARLCLNCGAYPSEGIECHACGIRWARRG